VNPRYCLAVLVPAAIYGLALAAAAYIFNRKAHS
jgi:hypothetical protein